MERAKEIATELSDNDITERIQQMSIGTKSESKSHKEADEGPEFGQMTLFDTVKDEDVINEIKAVDLSNITPLEALNKLSRYQNMLINRWKG